MVNFSDSISGDVFEIHGNTLVIDDGLAWQLGTVSKSLALPKNHGYKMIRASKTSVCSPYFVYDAASDSWILSYRG